MDIPKDLSEQGVPVAHLKIGECIFCRDKVLISTVLGSCVAVTFFDPKTRFAAMFHAMLPRSEMVREARMPCNAVDAAFDCILERFSAKDVRLSRLETKLFGGANTMRGQGRDRLAPILDVGRKNVLEARKQLDALGLRPDAQSTLGDKGRKVVFFAATGEAWMRYVTAEAVTEQLAKY